MGEFLGDERQQGFNNMEAETPPLTLEIKKSEQLALFRALYSQLMNSVRLEMNGVNSADHKVLREIFMALAENLGKKDFELGEKIGMGLTDLLTEEELETEAAIEGGFLRGQAKYLLSQIRNGS